MDSDSLDWIWQDFKTGDNPREFNESVDDSDSGSSDVSSNSSEAFALIMTDGNANRELREIVDEAERERVNIEGDLDHDSGELESISVEDLEAADDEFVDRFYIDALDAVESKISEVRLVWTDVLDQCTVNEKNVPESYTKTTNIEKLTLLYASNFIEQFKIKYPNRRPLSLVLKNECGVQKCVCTTIKPSRLVYHDLKDLISYSEFVANYITYVKLEDPTTVPKKIVSPSTSLEKQTANCFELATLLASFLVGFGYNAFVVQGYATKSVCDNDLSQIKLDMSKYHSEPKSDKFDDEENVDELYAVDFKIDMSSEFVNFLIEEEKKKSFIEDDVKENNVDHFSDPLYGRRVHCWIMIIPLEVEDEHTATSPYFIEPSVGERREVSDESYIGIESVWNHKNYWINLQSLNNGCTEYDFTLTNGKYWEQFLPDRTQHFQESTLDRRRNENESSRTLIMPNSWVSLLVVPRNKYLMRYPMGKKVTRYMNAIKKTYAEYTLPDGLMKEITFYAETGYKNKVFTKELYRHRVDKLKSVEKRFSGNEIETVEYFNNGRNDCLKTHTFSGNSNLLNTKRSFVFYNLRIDSMFELKVHHNSFITTFKNRLDLLFWRGIEFEEPEYFDGQIINSKRKPKTIIEKYLRNESKHKDRDVATRYFNLTLNNIFVLHQYGNGQITQSKRLFLKPTVGSKEHFDPTSVTENIVYPYEGYLKPYESYMMLQEMLEAETEAIRIVSKLEDEVIEILENRSREQSECKLKIHALDWDRNYKTRKLLQNKKDKKLAIAKRDDAQQIDYAFPYLERSKGPYTYDQVLKMRDNIINQFRKYTNDQFIRAKNSFIKKEAKMRSIMEALEIDDFKDIALKNKMLVLGSSLKNELDVLTMKMQRYKEIRAERYNIIVTYLNSKPEFKIVPPMKLLDLNETRD